MSLPSQAASFVRAEGTQFVLNGEPFHVRGANNYYLGFAPDSMVEPVFALAAQMGLNTLRTWAFLDCGAAAPGAVPPGASQGAWFQYWNSSTGKPDYNDGPDGFERLDRTIAFAEERGIRLILPLVNHWPDFGGAGRYAEWFGLADREEFYRNPQAKQAYRDYVEHVLSRVNTRTGRHYRDEPAILAWELANEPRCESGTDTLTAWVSEMSTFIRSIDTNHPIGVGDEGFFRRALAFGNPLYNGSMGVDCERLLALSDIDFGTCHLYPAYAPGEPPLAFGRRWIREHIEAANKTGKPMLIEEYGVKAEAGDAARKEAYDAWMNEVEQSAGAGALLWMIAGPDYPDYDGYTVYG